MKKRLFAILGIVLIGFSLFFSHSVKAISDAEITPETEVEQALPELDSIDKTAVDSDIKKPETKQVHELAIVDTYEKLVAAMNNSSVSTIEITADINGMGTSTTKISPISRDLSINANNHNLNIGAQYISLTYLDILPNHTFKLSNAKIANSRNGEGFIDVASAGRGKWNLEFTNITAESGSVNRVAQAHRCVVTMRGVNNISTYYENFELGSFIVDKGATYNGDIYGAAWAVIDFTIASSLIDTAYQRQFLIDDGASLKFTTSFRANGTADYPPIWGYYKIVTLGKNSIMKASWGHDIIRANSYTDDDVGEYPLGLTIQLREGSIMDFDNVAHHNYPAINMDSGTNYITMEPGATLKATSDGIYGALAFDGGTNSFYANQPKLVDLKNLRTNYKAFITTVGAATDFTIENTDVSYWETNVDDDTNPTGSFTEVKKINSKITNKWSSDPPDVATTLNAAKVQRFATKYVEKGSLAISEFPSNVSFGTDLIIPTSSKVFPAKNIEGELKVTDTRATKQNWQLGVTILRDMTGTNTNHLLTEAMHYKSASGDFQLNESSTVVEKHKNVDNDYSVSNNWNENAGLYLLVTQGAREDTYEGQIRWDIRDVPA